ncbi:Transcription initiation factor TFIID subunit 13 [Penicillium cataractarum]|uniref:Transcription initiation factor TFIID subunit 13 n=1 Tax=Penicillium cataractarum TaxID=2100454 RepID=A0A9W9V680_9EURO|nr:Transcription initiation factor TFIID subunit 13 [Penicillium cataractarum]KAJ5370242.1 Transcription initiation factor TFIID subunit 13 [Penicillium cataractarum]
MKFDEDQELDRGKIVQGHERLAAIQARILPAMSARRTAHLELRPPHRNQQQSPPTPLPNPTPSPTPPRQVPKPPSKPSPLSNSVHLPIELSPPWPWNPAETQIIRAGYRPAFKPPAPATSPPEPEATTSKKRARKPKPAMAEPRARAARHKGQMNFSSELRLLLLAYGDPSPHPSFPSEPLPETVRVLDEIVTDFILELCHGAAQVAHHARRQKIKVDDFRFALRRDPNKLGRVQELLRMERELKEARKAFDQNDDQVAKDAGKKGAAPPDDLDAESVAGTTTTGKKSKGKGKRAAAPRRESDATEESVPKKRKTIG